MKYSILASIVLLFAVCASEKIYDGIQITNVERNIDLASQFAQHTVKISLTNAGSQSASHVYLSLPSNDKLGLLEVFDESKANLQVSVVEQGEVAKDDKKLSYTLYKVQLKKNLEPKGTIELTQEAIYTHTMTPYPAAISQADSQLVKYNNNHYFLSPYTVKSQVTKVKLPSSTIESKTEQAPVEVNGDTITYGPYEDIRSFSYSPMSLHFENNKPFLTVTKMVKELEVSHWGNLAVEETYEMRHDGAKLKEPFSRYDFQRNPNAARTAVSVTTMILPPYASDAYYRDEIGNISTSHIALTDRGVTLELLPRFPLFGGWKTAFYMGFNLPLQHYLGTDENDSGLYVLNATFATTYDDVAVDELVVRVILPEGARDIEFYTPFPVDGSEKDVHYTYLDTSGRPVLVIRKKNVVPQHNQYFQVTYRFSQISMLYEPFLLIGAFFLFFLFVMIYVRLEFNIGPQKQRSPQADRIEEMLVKLRDVMDQRQDQHQSFEALVRKVNKSNLTQCSNEKKTVEAALGTTRKELQSLVVRVNELDTAIGQKVRDIEQKEGKKTDLQARLFQNEVSHARKEIPTSEYQRIKEDNEKQYNALDEEIETQLVDLTENL